MIKAILFDLDDTLYEERQFVQSGFQAVSEYMMKKYYVDKEKFYNLLTSSFESGLRGNNFNFVLRELDIYNLKTVEELIEVYRNHIPNINLNSKVSSLLSNLRKKFSLGLITDGDAGMQRRKISSLRLKKYLKVIIHSDDFGKEHWKPYPLVYQIALEKLKVKPDESIYVGDNPKKDFIGAKQIGMCTIRIVTEAGEYSKIKLSKEYEADYEIEDLEKIRGILIKINGLDQRSKS